MILKRLMLRVKEQNNYGLDVVPSSYMTMTRISNPQLEPSLALGLNSLV